MDINEILIPEQAIESVEDGHWIDDIIGAPTLKLKVRGLSSRKVQNYRDNKFRRVARKDRDAQGNIKAEVLSQITRDTLVEVVLLDWDGIKENGKPVPYSKDLARKWLTSRNGDRLVGFVTDAALQVDDLQNETTEELEKNSSPS
ncbi:hypothetical protein ACSBPU_05565 [Parapusillimonas sp. JC17]|uniref:hypothetical protein n=1 Tax=Parapusillimonas sp. JC17 TaxID=3445768 RepID=UPI003FA190EB